MSEMRLHDFKSDWNGAVCKNRSCNGENTGVLELSKVHDPKVIRIAAVYAIILSFIPKMAEVIGNGKSVPNPVSVQHP